MPAGIGIAARLSACLPLAAGAVSTGWGGTGCFGGVGASSLGRWAWWEASSSSSSTQGGSSAVPSRRGPAAEHSASVRKSPTDTVARRRRESGLCTAFGIAPPLGDRIILGVVIGDARSSAPLGGALGDEASSAAGSAALWGLFGEASPGATRTTLRAFVSP